MTPSIVIRVSMIDDMSTLAFLKPLLHSFPFSLFKLHQQRRMEHFFDFKIRLTNNFPILI